MNDQCAMCGKFLKITEDGFCDKCIPKAIEEARLQGVDIEN